MTIPVRKSKQVKVNNSPFVLQFVYMCGYASGCGYGVMCQYRCGNIDVSV